MSSDNLKIANLAEGLNIEFSDMGKGTAVLFLHGYSDSWFSFDCVAQKIKDKVRAISPTHRGHGGSSKPKSDYSIEKMASDAVALLDFLDIPKALVCGHSMGTFIAQELAVSYPDRVSALSIVGGALRANNQVLSEFSQELTGFSEVTKAFVTEFQMSTVSSTVDAQMMDKIISESMKMPANLWQPILDCLIAYQAKKPLKTIKQPVMIHWGSDDGIFSSDEQTQLQEALLNSTFHEYKGVGHGLHWERPNAFAQDLLAFIKNNQL